MAGEVQLDNCSAFRSRVRSSVLCRGLVKDASFEGLPMTFPIWRRLSTACLIITYLASPCFAQEPAPLATEKAQAVDKAVAAEIARQKLVGVAIGIIQLGRIVHTKNGT